MHDKWNTNIRPGCIKSKIIKIQLNWGFYLDKLRQIVNGRWHDIDPTWSIGHWPAGALHFMWLTWKVLEIYILLSICQKRAKCYPYQCMANWLFVWHCK